MSIDYRTCECGEIFADCADGYREEVITHEDGSKEEIRSCNFCRGDDFGDKELLEFVTSSIGVSRDDLVNFYKRYKTELKNDKACRLNGFISSVFTNKDSDTGKGFVLGGLVGRFESIHE